MKSFIVKELENGALISLNSLLKSLEISNIENWQLRNLEFHTISPLTMPFSEIERNSCSASGFKLTNKELQALLENFPQVVNGEFYAFLVNSSEPAVQIICEDASQWEISINSEKKHTS
jgi:hypothetical protein